MLERIRKLLPRVQICKTADTNLVSVRWVLCKFDYVKKDGMRFIQFGEGKIKWLMWLSNTAKCPFFLSSFGWNVRVNLRQLKLGTTIKPLDFKKAWRNNNDNRQRRNTEGNQFVRLGA